MISERIGKAIVVTGSRKWTDVGSIAGLVKEQPGGTVIIHGDCPTGADRIVADLCRGWGCGSRHREIAMPAQWERDGKSAGPRRNQEMLAVAVALRKCGWEVEVHAFPLPGAVGTAHCTNIFNQADFQVIFHGHAPYPESNEVDW